VKDKMKFSLAIVIIVLLQYISCSQLLQSLIVGNDENIKFSFANCGPKTDPLQVQALSISPDPFHFPANLTITAAVALANNVSSPVTV
jgi:hypothetical protein